MRLRCSTRYKWERSSSARASPNSVGQSRTITRESCKKWSSRPSARPSRASENSRSTRRGGFFLISGIFAIATASDETRTARDANVIRLFSHSRRPHLSHRRRRAPRPVGAGGGVGSFSFTSSCASSGDIRAPPRAPPRATPRTPPRAPPRTPPRAPPRTPPRPPSPRRRPRPRPRPAAVSPLADRGRVRRWFPPPRNTGGT